MVTLACAGKPGTGVPAKVATAKASPGAATPTPLVVAAVGLQKPLGDVREVTGTVLLDGNYAVARAGAHIVSNNGGSVLQLAGVVANNGGSIISDNGAGVIANNGGSVIANNGGSAVSRSRALLAETAPPIGTVLPAAGLTVRVVNLADGKDLTLGLDAQGAAVTSVKTDDAGKYKLYLATSETQTLRVVATPPGPADERLSVQQLVAGGAVVDLDDVSTSSAQYNHDTTATTILRLLGSTPDAVTTSVALDWMPKEMLAVTKAGRLRLLESCKKLGWQGLSAGRRREVADRMADAVLASVPLEQVRTYNGIDGTLEVPEQSAAEGIKEVLRTNALQAAKLMQGLVDRGLDPEAHFAAAPEMIRINATLDPPAAIRKPSDVNTVLVRGVLANPAFDEAEVTGHLQTLILDPELGLSLEQAPLLVASVRGNSRAIAEYMYAGEAKGSKAVEEVLRLALGG